MTTQTASSLWAGLDDDQARAVGAIHGPVLVVAGPGSGKTRVLTRRLAALVESGVWASRLLAVTFTNKAAGEMRTRLADVIGEEEAKYAQVSTFHSLCAKLLRMYHAESGLPRNFTIVDDDEAGKLIARAVIAAGLATDATPRADLTLLVKQLKGRVSAAKNAGLGVHELAASNSPDERETALVMAEYAQLLHRNGGVDFDDLLLRVRDLLRHPETAGRIAARWTHVSVDEFQDTNMVQYEIVSRLVAGHRNVCVVGDADQSIYGFRGAQASVLERFVSDFPEATRVVLNSNYRSTSNICAVSRSVIAANEAIARSEQLAANGAGDKATLTGFATDRDEARAVVDAIVRGGPDWSQHAVLVRTNALTRSLEQELTTRHLPYEVVGATRFYERAEVRDAMAWMRLVANGQDRSAFDRAVSSPRRGLGPAALKPVIEHADDAGLPIVDALAAVVAQGGGRGAAALAGFFEAYTAVRDASLSRGPAAGLRQVFSTAGLRQAVADRDAKEHTSRVDNLDQMLTHAEEFADHPEGPEGATAAFLEAVQLLESADEPEVHDDGPSVLSGRVQLLTIHAAKGREFNHVYLVGVEEDVLPHQRAVSSGSEDEIAEERRLMFVATSRARRTLSLSWCLSRMKFGQVTPSMPSRFLDEIPRHLLNVTDPPSPTSWGGDGYDRPRQRAGGFGQRTGGYGQGAYATTASVPAHPARASAPGGRSTAKRPARPSILESCAVNDRVVHAMFGAGVILEVDPVADSVKVRFDEGGAVKTLAGSLAPLVPEADA